MDDKMDMLKTTITYEVSADGEIKVKQIERESFCDDPYKYELMYESYDEYGDPLDEDDFGERPMKEVYYDVFTSRKERQYFIDNPEECTPTFNSLM